MIKTSACLKGLAIASFFVLSLAPVSQAANGTWYSTNGVYRNTFWTNSWNWSAQPYPAGVQIATFNNTVNSTNTMIDVSGLTCISNITFDTGSVAAYTIGSNGVNAQTLILTNSSFCQMTAGAINSQRFNAALQLGTDRAGATHTFINSNLVGSLTFAGDLIVPTNNATAGAKALVINGIGNVAFTGNLITNGSVLPTITDNSFGKLTLSGSNVITTLTINGGPNSVVDIGSGYLSLENVGGTTLYSSQGGTITGTGKIRMSTLDTIATTGNNYGDCYVAPGKILVINPEITGPGGFEMWSGAGTFVFNGINTFAAHVIISPNGAAISVWKVGNSGSTTSNLGQGTNVIFSGTNCKLIYTGAGETSNRQLVFNNFLILDQSGSGNLNFSTSPTLSSGGKTLTLQGSTSGTGEFSGVLANSSGTLSVTKTGTGTWLFSTNNTYTGSTTVSGGTLALTGVAGSILSSSVTLGVGGTLLLDNKSAANNTNRLSNANTVTMTGGTLRFSNNGGAANYLEAAGPLSISQGTNTVATVQAAPGMTSTLTFSSLTRTAGATVNFSGAGLGGADGRNKVILTAQANGLIGSWATVNGTNLAAYSATLGVYAATEPAYNQEISALGPSTITSNATDYVRISTQGTSGSIQLDSQTTRVAGLTQNTIYDATINTSGKTLQLSGISIPASKASVSVGANAGDGTLSALTSGGDLALNNAGNGILTVNAVIADNGAASSLTKMGNSTLTLTSDNTFSGATTIGGGSLVLANSNALQNSTLSSAGAIFDSSVAGRAFTLGGIAGAFNTVLADNAASSNAVALTVGKNNASTAYSGNLTGGGSLTKIGNGTLSLSGTNSFSGGLSVSAGQVTASSVGALGTGAVVNNGTLNLTGASDITYTGLSAALSGYGTNNVTLGTGSATVYLQGNYSGFTGLWNIGIGAAAGAAKVFMNGADNAAATINVMSNGTFYCNAGTHAAKIILRGGDTGESYGQLRVENGAVWSGPVSIAGNITSTADGLLGSTTGNGTIDGLISDFDGMPHPVAKMGAGTIALTGENTFKGQVWIRNGTLRASSIRNVGAASSSLGAPANAADGMIRFGSYTTNAVLTYFGMGDSSDRAIDFAGTTGGATIDQSGTNALTLTGGMIASAAGTKTLTLQGSTVGTGEFSGVISNGASSAIFVTKAGTGVWKLSGANSYTGGTTMSSGTLIAANPKALGTGVVSFPNVTATLDFANDGAGETPYTVTMNSGTVATLKSNVATPGAGINHTLGDVWLSSVTVIVTNGDNVLSGSPSLTLSSINLWAGNAGSTSILIPTTADLLVGSITIATNNYANKLIQLDGTSLRSAVTGAISNGLNTVLLTKSNTGTWTLNGSNTYSGATAINGGKLVLSGPNGALLGTGGITLTGGSTLRIENAAATNNVNRLADGGAVTLNGGVLDFFHSAGATNYSETAGALSVGQSSNAIATAQADVGYTSAVTFTSLTRTGSGTVNFMGAGLGSDARNQILFTAAPALVNGIIGPWAIVNGTDLATYGTYGITAYSGGYADIAARGPSSVVTNDATANVRINTDGVSGPITLATSPTDSIYTLTQNTATPAVVTTTNTLLLASGILIGAGQEALTIGANEGEGLLAPLTSGGNLLLANNSASVLTINASVTNNSSASSVTKSGVGNVRLKGAIAYTGATTINDGTLSFASSATQTIAGIVSGGGALTQEGTNRLTLSGANTYEGVTTVSKGILLVNNNTALGSAGAGTVISNGATLDVGAPMTANTLDLGSETFLVGGAGVNGRGAIINSSAASQYANLNRVSLTDNTTFGGENASARWDLRKTRSAVVPSLLMNDFNITKLGSNMVVFTSANVLPGTGNIEIVQGSLSLESSTTMNGSQANVLTVRTGATFDVYSMASPVAWSLVMDNNSTFNVRAGTPPLNIWSGPVTVNGTANLTGGSGYSQTISGDISGAGTLVKNVSGSTTYLVSSNNTYSGATIVSNGTLNVKYTGSLPGYSTTGRVTIVGGGTLAVQTGDGATGWSSDQINALHTNANPLANSAVLAIDATLAPAPDVNNVRKNYALAKLGTNSLTLSGLNAFSGAITVSAGTLNFNSFSTNALGSITVNAGALNFNSFSTNAMGAVSVNAGALSFGSGSSNYLGGSVSIKGGAVMTVDGVLNMTTNAGQTITVGSAVGDRSVATFSTNAIMGKLMVGNGIGSSGTVIQNGGALTVGPMLNSVDVLSLGSSGGYGYYRLSGGTMSVGQFALTGSGFGANVGVADLFSGTVNVGPVGSGNWLIWDWAGGSGVLNIFNGAIYGPLGNDITMAYSANKNAFAMLNLLGPAAFLSGTAYGTSTSRRINLASQAGNEASVVNLNGGTILANQIMVGSAGTPSYLNLGGGTLKVNTGTAYASAFLQGLTAATVYPGGVTIDTTNATVTVNQALQSPTGYGVASLSLQSGGAGYIGAPFVKITGGSGTGATAIATVDLNTASPTAGQVTGLIVTSPGVGYQLSDQLFVTLNGGGFTTAAVANNATLGSNSSSGGLTKLGIGTLTLGGVNTYGGTTTIGSGTLKLGSPSALPANTPVALAGGTLDLNGYTVTNTISGSGVVTNGTLLTVISPAGDSAIGTDTFTLKSATLQGSYRANVTTGGASDLVAAQGNINLSGLALQIVDTDQLNRQQTYTILTCSGTRTGTFSATNLPDSRWHVIYGSDGSVKLIFLDGTLLRLL